MTSDAEEQVRRKHEAETEACRQREVVLSKAATEIMMPTSNPHNVISVEHLREILDRHCLVIDKTKNTRMNCGMSPEFIIVQALNKIIAGVK